MYEVTIHYTSGRIETILNVVDYKVKGNWVHILFEDNYCEIYNSDSIRVVTFKKESNVQK
jgi:hypothetical protein